VENWEKASLLLFLSSLLERQVNIVDYKRRTCLAAEHRFNKRYYWTDNFADHFKKLSLSALVVG